METLIRSIPNFITLTRIIMSFVFVNLIINLFIYGENKLFIILAIFSAICLSDFIDGKLARKLKSTSVFGAKLDVFADLFYILLSYTTLVVLRGIPLWFLCFVIFKFIEFVMTSKFIKLNSDSSSNPFVFDKIGRIVSATFFIIPGIACIYHCYTLSSSINLLNCFLYVLLAGGVYSSFQRIKTCLMLTSIKSNTFSN
ncbi:MAG: CDP-alcohol phosphatidyltransferase family protein [Clostridiaceae bacterium]